MRAALACVLTNCGGGPRVSICLEMFGAASEHFRACEHPFCLLRDLWFDRYSPRSSLTPPGCTLVAMAEEALQTIVDERLAEQLAPMNKQLTEMMELLQHTRQQLNIAGRK